MCPKRTFLKIPDMYPIFLKGRSFYLQSWLVRALSDHGDSIQIPIRDSLLASTPVK